MKYLLLGIFILFLVGCKGNVSRPIDQISWTAPTTYTDGSPLSLSDIGGYILYYGTNQNNINAHINIPDGTLTSYPLNLQPGIYYVQMSTVLVNGTEGPRSPIHEESIK